MPSPAPAAVRKRILLRHGEIEFDDQGTGRPVVFVHGVLTNGTLWRDVAPDVAAAGHRCLVPDWPFGAHRLPMPTSPRPESPT